MEILAKVLAEIKPSKKEEIEVLRVAQQFASQLKPRFKEADIFLGGSIAKGTWLNGNYDFDVFVRFDYKKFAKDNQLSDRLERELKKLKLKYERIHGSRDYFFVKTGKVKFEVVPILKINSAEKAMNITDISPLHVQWVKKKMNEKLADEVRLLKAFCHCQNLYGAESHIRGFSGYACEILVVHAGSFINVLKAASHWTSKEIIDVEKFYRHKNPLNEMNHAKTEGPLVLVDPVQKTRNVTAALSTEKFNLFAQSASKFLKKPSIEYFKKEKISEQLLAKKAKGRLLVIVKAKPLKGKDDVIGAKMLKAFEYAQQQCKKHFRLYEAGWSFEDQLLWFYFDKKILPEFIVLAGPPLENKEHVRRFKSVHKNTFEKDKKIQAREKRRYRKPQQLLKELALDPYIKSRLDSWRVA